MAFCTGCGDTFKQTHLLRAHRNTFRCGGQWKPPYGQKYMKFVEKHHYEPQLEDKTAGVRIDMTYSYNYIYRWGIKTQRVLHRHKARRPGMIRVSRLPGGSGDRNAKLGQKHGAKYY